MGNPAEEKRPDAQQFDNAAGPLAGATYSCWFQMAPDRRRSAGSPWPAPGSRPPRDRRASSKEPRSLQHLEKQPMRYRVVQQLTRNAYAIVVIGHGIGFEGRCQ